MKSRKIELETEFSKVGTDKCKFVQERRISVASIQRSIDKVLEASLGQGSESWSMYLSFEDL